MIHFNHTTFFLAKSVGKKYKKDNYEQQITWRNKLNKHRIKKVKHNK